MLKRNLTPIILCIFFMILTQAIVTFKIPKNNIIHNRIARLEQNIAKIEKRNNALSDRVHMLGVLHNENWVIYKNAKCRSNTMFILNENGEWKIKHMPRHLHIDPITREKIEEYIID